MVLPIFPQYILLLKLFLSHVIKDDCGYTHIRVEGKLCFGQVLPLVLRARAEVQIGENKV